MSILTREPRSAAPPRTRGVDRATCSAAGRGRNSTFPSASAGFTLLEATVALTIFSAGALALYGLFNTNLVALQRVRDAASLMPAAYRTVAHLSAINPRQQEEGRLEFDDYEVVWSARLLEPVRQGQDAAGYLASYEIGLYRVEFTLSERGRPVGTYRLRLVGYENVRGEDPSSDEGDGLPSLMPPVSGLQKSSVAV